MSALKKPAVEFWPTKQHLLSAIGLLEYCFNTPSEKWSEDLFHGDWRGPYGLHQCFELYGLRKSRSIALIGFPQSPDELTLTALLDSLGRPWTPGSMRHFRKEDFQRVMKTATAWARIPLLIEPHLCNDASDFYSTLMRTVLESGADIVVASSLLSDGSDLRHARRPDGLLETIELKSARLIFHDPVVKSPDAPPCIRPAADNGQLELF